MESKLPTPPDKAHYRLINNLWQRCSASQGEFVVCVVAPIKPVYNEFMYAIDLRSQQKITDLNEVALEICIDIDLCEKEQSTTEENQNATPYYTGGF